MIAFTSFPQPAESSRSKLAQAHVADDNMLLDDENWSDSSLPRLTCPGETLTSAQAYMRYYYTLL
jgi:exosome complex component RRP4